jgi:hypothetical protein
VGLEGIPEGLYTRPAVPASSRRRSARPPRPERVERASVPAPPPTNQPASGIALRFVSCGILSLCFGLLWKLTLAPHRVGAGSALLGILFLLLGFVVGGMLWYFRDVRLRTRDPALIPDERLVFSFIVFALMPFAVLGVVGVVWVVALVVGAR